MSEQRSSSFTNPSLDLSRLAVHQARQRMIAAAARPIAVKWRSVRRGDRPGTPKPSPAGAARAPT